MVDQKLENLIKNIQKEYSDYFTPATIKDVNRFQRMLCKYDLKKVVDFYKFYQPTDLPLTKSGAQLLDIEGIFVESFYGEPGKCLSKFGVFTFATTIGGNLICFDANDIVNGEPSVLYADHDFCFYDDEIDKVEISGQVPYKVRKEKGYGLIFNYENIKDCLFKFEERFSEFFIKAIKGEYLLKGKYDDIEYYVEDNRGEYVL